MISITTEVQPNEQDLKTISQGIQTFNQQHLPDDVVFEKDTNFAVFARNEQQQVIGGIRAVAFWNYCIIELLWLDEKARGLSIGSKLIAATEAFAKENGFNHIRTETLDFQAKGFYEKQGFSVFGSLPDYPVGHTTYCLVKSL